MFGYCQLDLLDIKTNYMTRQTPNSSLSDEAMPLVRAFFDDEDFRTFNEKCAGLDSFDLLSIIEETKIGENTWSRVLAYLLDSRKNHGLGQQFIRKMIRKSTRPDWFETLPPGDECYVVSITEWRLKSGADTRRADILLLVYDFEGTVRGVIGIENKIGAREQPNQVRDYQNAIIERFGQENIKKLMLFLSPDGKASETADTNKSCQCPCIPISYRTIQHVCGEIGRSENTGKQSYFLTQILKCRLEKMLHQNEHPLQQEINQLYQKHRQAIRILLANLPNVTRLFDALQQKFGDWKPDKFRCQTYNKNGACEFKVFRLSDENKLHQEGVVWTFRIFHPENNPDIGDDFHLSIDIWVQDKLLRKKWRDWEKRFLENTTREHNEFWEWVNLWQGDKHVLTDLGEKDAEYMFQKLVARIENTEDAIRNKISEFRLLTNGGQV